MTACWTPGSPGCPGGPGPARGARPSCTHAHTGSSPSRCHPAGMRSPARCSPRAVEAAPAAARPGSAEAVAQAAEQAGRQIGRGRRRPGRGARRVRLRAEERPGQSDLPGQLPVPRTRGPPCRPGLHDEPAPAPRAHRRAGQCRAGAAGPGRGTLLHHDRPATGHARAASVASRLLRDDRDRGRGRWHRQIGRRHRAGHPAGLGLRGLRRAAFARRGRQDARPGCR